MSFLIGFNRNKQGKIEELVSEIKTIHSFRCADYLSAPFRSYKMEVIPLAIEEKEVRNRQTNEDYARLPNHLRKIFEQGNLLRTTTKKSNEYSVFMGKSLIEDAPEGRTGVLLYHGNPATLSIAEKEFIIEIKGVGCPDGNNSRNEWRTGNTYYGRLDCSQGEREFSTSEILRRSNIKDFENGDLPRMLLNINYWVTNPDILGLQSYVLRASPSTVRASFGCNPGPPKIGDSQYTNCPKIVSQHLAEQSAQLLSLDDILMHSYPHPENLVLAGDKFVITDYSDIRPLKSNTDQVISRVCAEGRSLDSKRMFEDALHFFVREIIGITEEDLMYYSRTILNNVSLEELACKEDLLTPFKLPKLIWEHLIKKRLTTTV